MVLVSRGCVVEKARVLWTESRHVARVLVSNAREMGWRIIAGPGLCNICRNRVAVYELNVVRWLLCRHGSVAGRIALGENCRMLVWRCFPLKNFDRRFAGRGAKCSGPLQSCAAASQAPKKSLASVM